MWVDIPVEGGTMGAFLERAPGRAPGLVMLQEIFGVNEAMQEKARAFAAEGFTVLVPDLFWRLRPRVSLGYGEEDRKAGFGYMQKFDFAAGVRDIAAAARWLEKDTGRKVAVVGFCLGGRLAVASTAAYPFAAVVSFYGVKLEADPARLRAIEAPLQVHVGDRDAHVPMSAVQEIQSIVGGKPNAEVFVYPGAQHGFFNPVRADVFAPDAAKQARARAVQALQRALG